MSSTIDNFESVVANASDLIETKAELWKLKAVGKISESVSSVISVIAIVILFGAAITILSFGVAYWIGYKLGNVYNGFFIVAGFYCLLGLILYFFRKKLIKTPLSNLIIDKISD
jgi:hypothetical protein